MRRRPRDFPADSGMGRRMSFARRWRAQALGLVFVIAFLAVAVSVASTARAAPRPIEPAAAMTVTVVLDKSSYLSGDTASATAIVYRTPAPANYTYTWRVRDFFFRLLNQTANGPATFLYPIALSYTGTLRFDVTVNDGQGLVVGSPVQSAAVAPAYMALSLDRGDYNPGDTISAYYSVASHVITRPTYTYEVDDSAATVVFSGATNYTFFSFTTPNPSSRFYLFRVTATDRGNSTQALATIAQASGFVLGVTFDKPSYVPGEVIHARLALTARGPASWPSQFRWSLTIGAVTATAITTAPAADFTLTLPAGTGGGGIVLFASEASTGATAIQSVPMAAGGVGFWSTDVGGAPVYAIVLGLLFLLLLVGVVGLWRRSGGGLGGFRFLHRGTPPPPPEGPTHAPTATPMSVNCRRCGKPIDLTTSRRPIEVMCPSCGETQVVT